MVAPQTRAWSKSAPLPFSPSCFFRTDLFKSYPGTPALPQGRSAEQGKKPARGKGVREDELPTPQTAEVANGGWGAPT